MIEHHDDVLREVLILAYPNVQHQTRITRTGLRTDKEGPEVPRVLLGSAQRGVLRSPVGIGVVDTNEECTFEWGGCREATAVLGRRATAVEARADLDHLV